MSNYDGEYYLGFKQKTEGWTSTGDTVVFEAGTEITIAIPEALRSLVYASGTPYMVADCATEHDTGRHVEVDMYRFNMGASEATVTLPEAMSMPWRNKSCGVFLPVKFFTPQKATSVTFDAANSTFDHARVSIPQVKEYTVLNGVKPLHKLFTLKFSTLPLQLIYLSDDHTTFAVAPSSLKAEEKQSGVYSADTTYAARVTNRTNLATDLWLAMAVPTGAYNMTSQPNDALSEAAVLRIRSDDAEEIYIRRAGDVTAADLAAVRSSNLPGAKLSDYAATIRSEWEVYNGGSLSGGGDDDVVLIAAFASKVAKGDVVRVDYDVRLTLPEGAQPGDIFRNNARMKYYSSATTQEAWSNDTQVTVALPELPDEPVETPEPTPEETPQPSPEGTPAPSITPAPVPTPGVIPVPPPVPVTPPVTPVTETEDEEEPEEPVTPISEPPVPAPLTAIPDEPVPLAPPPTPTQNGLTTILDEDVPLANLPKTGGGGDAPAGAGLMALLMAALARLKPGSKKK